MVGSTHPLLLILTCALATTTAAPALGAAADPPAAKTEAAGPKPDRPADFALPDEDPPQVFVPLRPMTVEDRRRIQALRSYSVARALEDKKQWIEAIAVLQEALKDDPESVAILRRLSRDCFAMPSRTAQALEFALRALDAEPDDSDTLELIVSYYEAEFDKGDQGRAPLEATVAVLERVLANSKLAKGAAGRLFADKVLGFLQAERLNHLDKAVPPLARLLDALDEKSATRLTSKDLRRIQTDNPEETYSELGKVFLQAKRYDLAVRAFERGLVYEPDHTKIPLQLAEALLNLGKNEQGLALVERYLKRQPNGNEGYELLSKFLTALKRQNEITPRLEEAAKTDSKNVLLQYALADHYRDSGQVEKADALYKQLLNVQPTARGFAALSTALLKRKKTDELLNILVQAIVKPNGADAVRPTIDAIVKDRKYAFEVIDRGLKLLTAEPPTIDRGAGLRLMYYMSSLCIKAAELDGESASAELEKLAEAFRVGIKLEPSPLLYRQLADTLRRQDKLAEAVKTIERLMEKYPDERQARTLIALGELRVAADQREGAVAAFKEALKLEPKDVEASYRLAIALSQSGKFDDAIAGARTALKDDPTNRLLNNLVGYVLTQAGKNDDAIAHYKGILEHYPNNDELLTVARSGLSVVYINLGDYAKGEAELEVLFKRNPDDPGVNNDLGYLYADQGKNLEKAESMIRKALQERPDEGAYLDSLGWVLFKRGKLKEAVEPLEKAVKKSATGTDATIHEHLGDVYFQLKDFAKAKDSWQKAEHAGAKVSPPEKRLPEIRKKLKSLEQLSTGSGLSADKTP